MWGWLGGILGTEKAVDNLLDKDRGLLSKAGAWVGNFNYTEEEKAEADKETREWGLRQLEALAPFKVVQRIIAFVVCGMWVAVGLNLLVAIWIDAAAKTDLMSFAMSEYIFWPVLAVFSLYFTGGVFPRKGSS